jgi:polyisoprenoid-binding protein YceI
MADNTFDPATTVVTDIKGDYTLDPTHSRLGFSTRHAMVTTVRGQFKDFTGEAVVDTADPAASKVEVNIQAASVDTGVADRDGHLRSGDFFDVETYPEITFVSTGVERDGDDWAVTGDLTIKDVTKPITIDFESTGSAKDPFGNLRIGFEGKAVLSRKDWGLTWNAALETGGMLVSDKIKLEFDISAIQK